MRAFETGSIVHRPCGEVPPLSSDAIAVARRLDALAIGVLVLAGVIAAATFRDYGLGWDDYTHSQYGDLLVSLYSSGFADKRALSFVNLYMYGGGFDLLSALAAKILPFGLFETRRLMGAAVGLVGLFVTWRLGRRLGGPLAGLIALVLLATCPLYWGHMFINAKDAPFAVATAIALLGIVRAFEEYPRATPATVALCGIGVGLAIGSRVMGGFAVLDALAAAAGHSRDQIARGAASKAAFGECGSFLIAFIPGAILAYLVMGLVWPWAVVAPLNPFHAVEYFSNFFEKPWRELFDGQLIPVPDMPRSYVPTLVALKLPELLLALGLARNGRRDRRGRARHGPRQQRRTPRRALSHRARRNAAGSDHDCGAAGDVQRHPALRVHACRRSRCSAALPAHGSPGGLSRHGAVAMAAGAIVPDRGHRVAGHRDGAAASVRVHAFQSHRRRRHRRAAALHARLLGIVADPGVAAAACIDRRSATRRRRAAPGRSRSAARIRQSTSRWAAIYDHLGSQRRRLRHDRWANSTAPSSMRRCCSRSCAKASSMRASMTSAAARFQRC